MRPRIPYGTTLSAYTESETGKVVVNAYDQVWKIMQAVPPTGGNLDITYA